MINSRDNHDYLSGKYQYGKALGEKEGRKILI